MPTLALAYDTGRTAALAVVGALLLVFLLRALGIHPRRPSGSWFDARSGLVVLVLAVPLVAAVASDWHRYDPWATVKGRAMHAEFIAGCHAETKGRLDCECAFSRVTAHEPYDTPDGFTNVFLQVAKDPLEAAAGMVVAFGNAFASCTVAA